MISLCFGNNKSNPDFCRDFDVLMKSEKSLAKKIILKLEKRGEQLKKFGVTKIGLFGSYLYGKQKKNSDIDLLVTLDDEGYKTYIDLWIYLDKVFRKKVDLVIEKNLIERIKYVTTEAKYINIK